jgi:3-hydroxymyristoyl/3-hydroxydecanoyl-(acyl carrier protein) dehydratase
VILLHLNVFKHRNDVCLYVEYKISYDHWQYQCYFPSHYTQCI